MIQTNSDDYDLEYWKQNYLTAIEVGSEMMAMNRAEIHLLTIERDEVRAELEKQKKNITYYRNLLGMN